MFTGLIKEIGKVTAVTENAEGRRVRINCSELINDINIDDSVSVNGACQTAVYVSHDYFEVQAIHTTLQKTTLGLLKKGDIVNLELAMKLSDRLGGHLVQGHVNGVVSIKDIKNRGKNYEVTFPLDSNWSRYVVQEGSICLHGISLTVSNVDPSNKTFGVSIIPHTWDNTVLHKMKVGDKVNLEVDILAKYVENLLIHDSTNQKSKISKSWLERQGYC